MSRKLVLIRHGQSEWNLQNLFTGWADVDLTQQGHQEAVTAAKVLYKLDFIMDIAITSVLKRSIKTLSIIMNQLDSNAPVIQDWRLNERHYGALQGLNKSETAAQYGEEQVKIWRRSFSTAPPPLDINDKRHPSHDDRYQNINNLPSTESLEITLQRVIACWNDTIAPQLKEAKNVLIVAHGNSLRALVKMLDKISDEKIVSFDIPTGIPLLYTLDKNLDPLSREFIGDPKLIAAAREAVANQGKVK